MQNKKIVNTVFSIMVPGHKEPQGFEVEGYGQETITKAIREHRRKPVKLEGFLIDGEFVPVNLKPHWENK